MRKPYHTLRIATGVLALCALAVLAPWLAPAAQAAPTADAAASSGRVYVTTIPPLGMILREVVGSRAEVRVLLPPGASPHTYEPKPSDARAIAAATAFFYGGEELDGWATELASGDTVELIGLVPAELQLPLPEHHHEHSAGHAHEHEHEHAAGAPEIDPHFWTSPRVVKAMLPALVEALSARDPQGAEEYRANADRFAAALVILDQELAATLAGVRGQYLLLFHPSFGYLMHDYGLELAAVVEPVPGQEPTPQLLAELADLTHRDGLKAVFTEPQLPRAPAETIARQSGLPLFELDPLGGGPGRSGYAGLLRYNARVLADALAQ